MKGLSYFVQLFIFPCIQFSLIYNFVHSVCTVHHIQKRFHSPFYCTQQFLTVHPTLFMCLNPVVQANGSLPSKECWSHKPLSIYTSAARLMTQYSTIIDTFYVHSTSKLILVVTHLQSEENLWTIISANCGAFYNKFTMVICLILMQGKLCQLCSLYFTKLSILSSTFSLISDVVIYLNSKSVRIMVLYI
jgi:hypothetical protein